MINLVSCEDNRYLLSCDDGKWVVNPTLPIYNPFSGKRFQTPFLLHKGERLLFYAEREPIIDVKRVGTQVWQTLHVKNPWVEPKFKTRFAKSEDKKLLYVTVYAFTRPAEITVCVDGRCKAADLIKLEAVHFAFKVKPSSHIHVSVRAFWPPCRYPSEYGLKPKIKNYIVNWLEVPCKDV